MRVFTFFLLLLSVSTAAQVSITGTVLDSLSGDPLFGATIRIGEAGTSTDFDGRFELSVDDDSRQIEVSYVGYVGKVVSILDGVSDYQIALANSNNILETAIVTGSKYEQTLGESVVTIDVLSPQLLENTNTNNVQDIISKVPGIQMIDGQPNIRAGSGWSYNAGNRVMLLIDDIPALTPEAGRAQWEDIPVESIAQVEVIKGAGSALYGSAAMNGVINVRTAFATSEPETKVGAFYTAYDDYADSRKNWFRSGDYNHTPGEYGISASHKQKMGKWDIVASAYHTRRDSARAYLQNDFKSKYRGNLNLRYRASDRITAGVNTIFNTGQNSSYFLWRNNSSGALQPYQGTVTKGENFRVVVDPYVTIYDKYDNRHRIQGRYYYNDNQNNLNQSNQSTMLYGEYQYQRKLGQDTRVSAGLVLMDVTTDSELFASSDVTQSTVATYAQMDQSVGDRLNLTGGIRYEYNKQNNDEITFPDVVVPAGEQTEGQWIGRLGANYELTPFTFLRASVGQAYRFPILFERYLSTSFGGFVIIPNPDLTSERGVTMEIGAKTGVRLGAFKGYFDVAVFNSTYDDMIEFIFVDDPVIGFKSQNIGNTRITGYEVSLAGQLMIGSVPVDLYGGYNYSDPTYRDYDDVKERIERTSSLSGVNVLKYRSKHNYTMDAQVTLGDFSIGGAVRGGSEMLSIDKILSSNFGIGEYRANVNKGEHVIVDARVGYKLRSLALSIHLKNLTNQEYTERPALIAAPRNLAVRLDYDIQ